jgi:hexosaminidase
VAAQTHQHGKEIFSIWSTFSMSIDHPQLSVLPQPEHITYNEGSFSLTRETVIATDQQTHALGLLLAEYLAPALGFTLEVQMDEPAKGPAIVLSINTELTRLGKEGYILTSTPERATISGLAPAGVFYGTQTLRQLLPVEIFSSTPVNRTWEIPAVAIEDAPRFPWRGAMLDPSRHFFPKQEILKMIDLLALHKMNILHLHLTDDQGWRIEIKKYPRLTEVGSQRKETIIGHAFNPQGYDGTPHGGFYRQDELREIVAYAAARSITVVPEIDMPGHAQAAVAAYPELGVTGEQVEVATIWGIHPYLYSPTEATLNVLRDVLTEVLEIFPSPYIHLGGDEAIKNQWEASPQVQERIKELGLKDEHELQSWFLTQMGNFLTQQGRLLIGWDEILEGGLPEGAAVMSWRGTEGGIAAAQAEHDVVMAPQSHVYFDHYQSNDPTEPLAIGGYTPLDKVYGFDPIPAELTPEQAKYVMGTQGTLWSEYILTTDHLEYMAFPRLIALAEVAWTAPEHRDFADFRQRLAQHEARLTNLNVSFRPVASWEQEQSLETRQPHTRS